MNEKKVSIVLWLYSKWHLKLVALPLYSTVSDSSGIFSSQCKDHKMIGHLQSLGDDVFPQNDSWLLVIDWVGGKIQQKGYMLDNLPLFSPFS